MERKKSFWSCLKTAMIIVFAIPVIFLVIVAISQSIVGDWKMISLVLGIIFLVVTIAGFAGCFSKKR